MTLMTAVGLLRELAAKHGNDLDREAFTRVEHACADLAPLDEFFRVLQSHVKDFKDEAKLRNEARAAPPILEYPKCPECRHHLSVHRGGLCWHHDNGGRCPCGTEND